jgi:hypothetical protein
MVLVGALNIEQANRIADHCTCSGMMVWMECYCSKCERVSAKQALADSWHVARRRASCLVFSETRDHSREVQLFMYRLYVYSCVNLAA